jgi:hypothetical protein
MNNSKLTVEVKESNRKEKAQVIETPPLTGGWKGGVLDFCRQISKLTFVRRTAARTRRPTAA